MKSEPASKVRQNLAEQVNRIHYRNEVLLIHRHKKPTAALVSYKAFRLFQRLLRQAGDAAARGER